MATVNRYNYSGPSDPAAYRLDPAVPVVNQVNVGDFVRWSGTPDFFLKPSTAGNGPLFIGVAQSPGPNPSSQIDNKQALVGSANVRRFGLHVAVKTTGDSLAHGDELVIGATAQTVLKRTGEDDSEIIAYAFLPLRSAALTGAGVVDVIPRSNFPATGVF